MAFAAHRWKWYCSVPKELSRRWCGNGTLGTIGIPLELGIVGALILLQLASGGRARVPVDGWLLLGCGVFGTTFVVGLPFFLYGVAYALFELIRSWMKNAQ